MKLTAPQQALRAQADPEIAKHSLRFFKTGKGEYGEGDVFLGVRVPTIRSIAKQHRESTLPMVLRILRSRFHEERLLALIMMVHLYQSGDEKQQKTIYQVYLANTAFVNGWDLVDSSAHQIVGGHLLNRKRSKLDSLAKSKRLWERRVAIIATYHFIKQDQFDDTLRIAATLLNDQEDLIHKATGWMLREVGNRDKALETAFLDKHYQTMPRMMLRYAIEKFSKDERQHYMQLTP